MSGPGRKASLPPSSHARPEQLTEGGLLVRHYDRNNLLKEYDFSTLAVAEPMQRSLAALFAAKCIPSRWASHGTSHSHFQSVRTLAEFLAGLDPAPRDLEELTASVIKRWRLAMQKTAGGCYTVTRATALLQSDVRLQSGRVADELAVRVRRPKSRTQSFSQAELDQIKVAARRTMRAALLRINHNARHLQRWRDGDFDEGSRERVVGEALDILARTGTLPHRLFPSGEQTLASGYASALGVTSGAATWQRLFLTRMEATALGVLLMAEYGWNLSVIDRAEVPRASPDVGEDGHPTYRIPLEKFRRGAGRYFETRNVTDDGAGSAGRLITEALEATRFARAVVEDLAPGTNRLLAWRAGSFSPRHAITRTDRQQPVGPFRFGVDTNSGSEWAKAHGFTGSPFRRGRRTVNALDRREPGQNTQGTHEQHYVLVDNRVQAEAVEIIAGGAEDAADRARRTVLVAELHDRPQAGGVETATASCRDYKDGPFPDPEGGCGASFLKCLECGNARIHPGHHARLAHLHRALANLRSILSGAAWAADWGDAHACLEDLRTKLGEAVWNRALEQVPDDDRDLITLLLTGDLDT